MISPSAETNAPELPLLKRTAEDRRWSAQPAGGSNLCLALRVPRGRLLKTHMPSSAKSGIVRLKRKRPIEKLPLAARSCMNGHSSLQGKSRETDEQVRLSSEEAGVAVKGTTRPGKDRAGAILEWTRPACAIHRLKQSPPKEDLGGGKRNTVLGGNAGSRQLIWRKNQYQPLVP